MHQAYQMMENHWTQSCVFSVVSQEWHGEEGEGDSIQAGQGLQKKHTDRSSGDGEGSGGGDDGIWGYRLKMGQGRRILS